MSDLDTLANTVREGLDFWNETDDAPSDHAALDALVARAKQAEAEAERLHQEALDWQAAKEESDAAWEDAKSEVEKREDERLALRASFYAVQERAVRAEAAEVDLRGALEDALMALGGCLFADVEEGERVCSGDCAFCSGRAALAAPQEPQP